MTTPTPLHTPAAQDAAWRRLGIALRVEPAGAPVCPEPLLMATWARLRDDPRLVGVVLSWSASC